MKHSILSVVLLGLFVSACSGVGKTSIDAENQNPLTASRYGDELADTLTNLIILKDPIAEEERMKENIQADIKKAKRLSDEARERMANGSMGTFISIQEETYGFAAFTEEKLYLASDFFTDPGPSLHVYLTTVVDPRDVQFPDETAIDLGVIQSTYGAQTYSVPGEGDAKLLRTAVLYDTTLKRIFGFAQLSSR